MFCWGIDSFFLIGILIPQIKGIVKVQGSILKISEAASIGIHSLIFLAKNKGRLFSLNNIATHLGVSSNHLSKVLQRLQKSGLIYSLKGRNGGFRLLKPAEEVNFLEIYEIFGGLVPTVNELVKEKFKKTMNNKLNVCSTMPLILL